MTVTVTIEGVDSLLKRLTYLDQKSSKRIVRAALRGAMVVQGRQIRRDTDKRVKNATAAVKSRFIKGRGPITGKVGFGVGKKGTRKTGEKESRIIGQGGVGISGRNIHWWVAETAQQVQKTTKERVQKKTNRRTGAMPAMQPGLAAIAYAKAAGRIQAEMIKRGALQLTKEIAKLQRIK